MNYIKAVSFLFAGLVSYANVNPPITTEAPQPPPLAPKSAAEIVIAGASEADKTFLSALEKCESNYKSDIKVLDTNNQYSFSILQFQLKTFYLFGKKYNLLPQDLELNEAENLIYDRELQEAIALKMFGDKLYDHWRICYGRIKNQN